LNNFGIELGGFVLAVRYIGIEPGCTCYE